jgi:hypothetical protein
MTENSWLSLIFRAGFNMDFAMTLHPDLLYVTAFGRQMCSYYLFLEWSSPITECDITGGDIKEVWLYLEMHDVQIPNDRR